MAIKRKSIVDQIEVTRDNNVQVRCALLLVDGDTELSSRWHRTMITPDTNPAEQMAAVNEHLALMKEAPISQDDIDRVVVFHALAVEHSSK